MRLTLFVIINDSTSRVIIVNDAINLVRYYQRVILINEATNFYQRVIIVELSGNYYQRGD